MKRYIIVFLLGVFALSGCKNNTQEFDFDYNPEGGMMNVYFPIQYPLRTIVLGETILYNSDIDKEQAFNIGVCYGGGYENPKTWTVDFAVDDSYLENVVFTGTDNPVKVMPSNYYTLNPVNTVSIAKGQASGLIKVELTEDFFNDPLAISENYVIPLEITDSDAPVITGTPMPGLDQANVHSASDWVDGITPKNFTLFGVKFINLLHGQYFTKGARYVDADGNGFVLENEYNEKYLEHNATGKILTAGYHTALLTRMGEFVNDNIQPLITFTEPVDGVGEITISNSPQMDADGMATVTGTGKYYESDTEFAAEHGGWLTDPNTGEKVPFMTITLDYTLTGWDTNNPTTQYNMKDTLVFQSNLVSYEEFGVDVVEPL